MKEDQKQKKSVWLRMLLIAAYLVFGVLFLALPDMVISILPVILGGLLVVETVLKVCRILTLWKNGYQNWWMPMIGCLILAILGILLAADIFEQTYTLIRIFGGGLLTDGFLEFWLQTARRKLQKPARSSSRSKKSSTGLYDTGDDYTDGSYTDNSYTDDSYTDNSYTDDDYIEVYDDPENDANV